MFKQLRISSLALAITLACTPAAIAFPPCPLDKAHLIPLDQSSGYHTSTWSSAVYDDAGTLKPVRIQVRCQPNFPEVVAGKKPRSGPCDEDVVRLDQLPIRTASASLDQPATHSPDGWVGYLGLPDLRLPESVDANYEYAFNLAVNTTRLAVSGDWVDIAEMRLGARDGTTPSTLYRLRKVQNSNGTAELRLIASTLDHGTGTPVRSVVAVVALDMNNEFQDIAMRWSTTSRTRHPPPLGPKPVVLPPHEYIVDTQLKVTAGTKVLHQAVLEDQMPDGLSIGVLDYNLPHAIGDDGDAGGATVPGSGEEPVGSGTTSSEPPITIPGINDPGRTLIFPTATISARHL